MTLTTINLSPVQKMMLGIAIGDAFGEGYEFAYKTRAKYSKIKLNKYVINPSKNFIQQKGMYSDDTQMSIAKSELMLSEKEFTKENLANSFVECFKRDPINGYTRVFQRILETVQNGTELLATIKGDSIKNGAAMRSVPLGIIPSIDEVVKYATINASVTHNTPKGIASSVAIGIISHINLYQNRLPDVETELVPILKNIDVETAEYLHNVNNMTTFNPSLLFGKEWTNKGVPCDAMRTVGAVLYILKKYTNPQDVLLESVKLGGDTDSTASIALGINLMHNPIDQLPNFLINDLTNHKYGRDYLLDLGLKLEQKYFYK